MLKRRIVIGFAEAEMASGRRAKIWRILCAPWKNYADIIALRHPLDGAAKTCCRALQNPIINGAAAQKNTRHMALMDLYTIQKRQGKIDGLKSP